MSHNELSTSQSSSPRHRVLVLVGMACFGALLLVAALSGSAKTVAAAEGLEVLASQRNVAPVVLPAPTPAPTSSRSQVASAAAVDITAASDPSPVNTPATDEIAVIADVRARAAALAPATPEPVAAPVVEALAVESAPVVVAPVAVAPVVEVAPVLEAPAVEAPAVESAPVVPAPVVPAPVVPAPVVEAAVPVVEAPVVEVAPVVAVPVVAVPVVEAPVPVVAVPVVAVPVIEAPVPVVAPVVVTPPPVVQAAPVAPAPTSTGPAAVVNQIPGSAFRWLAANNWTVEWRQGPGPGRQAEAQYATRTIVIWHDNTYSSTTWAGVFAHELGHAVAFVHFGTQQMNDWNTMRGINSWRWVPGSPGDFYVGEGDFAEAFMNYLIGHRVRSIGGPLTAAQAAWIAANTPF